MEKEITIYHVVVFDVYKEVEYPKHDYEPPEAIANANIRELYSFRTSKEASDKHRELVKYINENREAFGIKSTKGIQVMTWNSKLVL